SASLVLASSEESGHGCPSRTACQAPNLATARCIPSATADRSLCRLRSFQVVNQDLILDYFFVLGDLACTLTRNHAIRIAKRIITRLILLRALRRLESFQERGIGRLRRRGTSPKGLDISAATKPFANTRQGAKRLLSTLHALPFWVPYGKKANKSNNA